MREPNDLLNRTTENETNSSPTLTSHYKASTGYKIPIRPTDYEYAVLAQQVYKDDGGQPPEGWKVYKTHTNSKDGYFGTAYINEDKQLIIIAHRGTQIDKLPELLKDLAITDIESIVRGKISSQQASALEFTLKVKKFADRKGYHISFAGHSLGAWLAEITTFHLAELGYYSRAVTLDSPGAKEMLEEIKHDHPDIPIKLEELDITTYLSAPNLVNSCNTHLGTVYRLYPKLTFNGLSEYLTYTLTAHSKDELVATFDPKTGMPRKMTQVKSWPHIRWPQTEPSTSYVQTLFNSVRSYIPYVGRSETLSNLSGAFLANMASTYLFNYIPYSKAFSNLLKLFIDIKSGKVDAHQYQGFHRFASQRNNYDPNIEDLNFHEQYELDRDSHYKVVPYKSKRMRLVHFHPTIQWFLSKLYKHWKSSEVQNCIQNLSKEHASYLRSFKIEKIKNFPHANQLIITGDKITVSKFCNQIGNIWNTNKSLRELFNSRIEHIESASSYVKTLNDMIIVEKELFENIEIIKKEFPSFTPRLKNNLKPLINLTPPLRNLEECLGFEEKMFELYHIFQSQKFQVFCGILLAYSKKLTGIGHSKKMTDFLQDISKNSSRDKVQELLTIIFNYFANLKDHLEQMDLAYSEENDSNETYALIKESLERLKYFEQCKKYELVDGSIQDMVNQYMVLMDEDTKHLYKTIHEIEKQFSMARGEVQKIKSNLFELRDVASKKGKYASMIASFSIQALILFAISSQASTGGALVVAVNKFFEKIGFSLFKTGYTYIDSIPTTVTSWLGKSSTVLKPVSVAVDGVSLITLHAAGAAITAATGSAAFLAMKKFSLASYEDNIQTINLIILKSLVENQGLTDPINNEKSFNSCLQRLDLWLADLESDLKTIDQLSRKSGGASNLIKFDVLAQDLKSKWFLENLEEVQEFLLQEKVQSKTSIPKISNNAFTTFKPAQLVKDFPDSLVKKIQKARERKGADQTEMKKDNDLVIEKLKNLTEELNSGKKPNEIKELVEFKINTITSTPFLHDLSKSEELRKELTQAIRNVQFFKAVMKSDEEVVKKFLSKGVDVNVKEVNGYQATALHHAVGQANENIIKILLTHGANPLIADGEGQTAINWIEAQLQEECAEDEKRLYTTILALLLQQVEKLDNNSTPAASCP